jgi:hypothetical protein
VTVKELIEQLQQFSENSLVVALGRPDYDGDQEWETLDSVDAGEASVWAVEDGYRDRAVVKLHVN